MWVVTKKNKKKMKNIKNLLKAIESWNVSTLMLLMNFNSTKGKNLSLMK